MPDVFLAEELAEAHAPSRAGGWFRQSDARKLFVRPLSGALMGITEIRASENFGMTDQVVPEDAFNVAFCLYPLPFVDLWYDGKAVSAHHIQPGQFILFDLKSIGTARFEHQVHHLHFHLSRSFLNALCDDLEAPRVDQLRVVPGEVSSDGIIHRLGNAVRPALDAPHEANELFASQLMFTFGTYLCATKSSLKTPRPVRGGLTAWQLRVVKALIDANLDGNVSLQYLASACHLSPMHLAHAFKKSTGVAPHQWLLLRRTERAKSLLAGSAMSLADIALECGFADQSHFTRVFRRATSVTPGLFRKQI